jgi:hypothetical protein
MFGKKLIGGLVASAFTLSYILAPLYVLGALILAPFYGLKSLIFLLPIIVSALTPIIKLPWLVRHPIFRCILDYFEFETVFETTDDSLLEHLDKLKKAGRGGIILAGQPHGVLSFGGICAGAAADQRFDSLVTAAAGAVLATPIVKHVVGVFGLIDAGAPSLRKHLAKGGVEGSCVLYTGGIAELFRCSESHETLILKKRKGFIKLALQTGADVVPMYFFGNTSVLSVLTHPFLESISRKYQISLTLFWGVWGLPIPRPHKVIYARGPPLGLPHLPNPTDEEISQWHEKYVSEVQRIFDTHKKRIPRYANRTLVIE